MAAVRGGDDNTGGETDGVISIKGDAINTDFGGECAERYFLV